MTLTIAWYAMHGHHPADLAEHRARAPWYQTKTNPSFADMLVKADDHHRRIFTRSAAHPYRRQITAIQQAWAAALR